MSPACVLTVVVLVIAVIAWALFRNTKTPAPEIHTHPEEIRAAEPVIETKAPSRVVEIPTKPDDQTRLEGIGPKVNQVLKNAGITTFARLAAADASILREALDAAGYRYMDPSGWVEQAKLAAVGKFDELKELQSRLKAGRKSK
jgi:predicted flap endonuclease-1-like 5' DNA nuclease